jgi:hypothetical protein
VVFSFRADGGTREAVEDLARREAACCPFLDYRVETVDDEVTWTISNPVTGGARASVDVTLDAFHALPDHSGSDFEGLLGRRADRGVDVIEVGDAVERVDAAEAVMSAVRPITLGDVRSAVCRHGHFFSSAAAATRWADEHLDGYVHPAERPSGLDRQVIKQLGWDAPPEQHD